MINISIVTYFTPINDVINAVKTCSDSEVSNAIFIIDNSSKDILSNQLKSFEKVNYIHNPSNPGYGAAHNIAIRKSLADNIEYHLVLNADVIFDSKMLELMLEYAKKNKNIGILAPKQFYEDGSIYCSRKLLPTPKDMFFRAFLTKFIKTKSNDIFQLEKFGYETDIKVPYVSGAFMFINTSALLDVGLFDERFFMYPEDIDISRRIAEIYDVLFCPKFTIIHKHGAASKKSFKMFLIHTYNMILYFNKWGWVLDKGRSNLNKLTLNQDHSLKQAKNL